MVKAFALSAVLAAASLATVAQGAALKQDPLFGCVAGATGSLGLGGPDDDFIPANFVAGNTQKSLITGKTGLSVLSTDRPSGDLDAGSFDFLDCTQSLRDLGFELNVPNVFSNLDGDYTYTYGILRNSAAEKNVLSIRSGTNAKGQVVDQRLLSAKYVDLPVQARTFISATADDGATNYLAFYPFAGTARAPKSGLVFANSNKYGSVAVSTNHTAHAGTTFLRLQADLP